MNNKQSSVIFLIEKIAENQLQRDLTMFEWANIFTQAIQMHKDEIKNAWINSLTKGDYHSSEEYYKETFNK